MKDMPAESIPANTITYDTAIRACQKGRQWQWALQLMEDMQAEGIPPDTITISYHPSALRERDVAAAPQAKRQRRQEQVLDRADTAV